jgi:hypothetical protein
MMLRRGAGAERRFRRLAHVAIALFCGSSTRRTVAVMRAKTDRSKNPTLLSFLIVTRCGSAVRITAAPRSPRGVIPFACRSRR